MVSVWPQHDCETRTSVVLFFPAFRQPDWVLLQGDAQECAFAVFKLAHPLFTYEGHAKRECTSVAWDMAWCVIARGWSTCAASSRYRRLVGPLALLTLALLIHAHSRSLTKAMTTTRDFSSLSALCCGTSRVWSTTVACPTLPVCAAIGTAGWALVLHAHPRSLRRHC